MKIKNLNVQVSSICHPVVVVNDLAMPYDFRVIESGALFTENLPCPLPEDCGGVIFADVTAMQFASWVNQLDESKNIVQYWAPAGSLSRLVDILENNEQFAIVGFLVDNSWIKLEMIRSQGGRPAIDLIVGLTAVVEPDKEEESALLRDPLPADQNLSDVSVRGVLISRLAHRAKPIKRYLPQWAIHGAYKVLGVLR